MPIAILSIWILVVLTTLSYFHSLSVERFFVLYFIGFMIIERLLRSPDDNPQLTRGMNVVISLGAFIFILLMLARVFAVFNA